MVSLSLSTALTLTLSTLADYRIQLEHLSIGNGKQPKSWLQDHNLACNYYKTIERYNTMTGIILHKLNTYKSRRIIIY